MNYKMVSLMLGIPIVILTILLITSTREVNQLNHSSVDIYNQFMEEIRISKSSLTVINPLSTNEEEAPNIANREALNSAFVYFQIAYGRISGAHMFQISTSETNAALVNMCIELNTEFGRLVPSKDIPRAETFLISQMNLAIRELPAKVSEINQIKDLNQKVHEITSELQSNFVTYNSVIE